MAIQIITTRAFPTAGTQDLGFVYGASCFSVNFFQDTAAVIRNTTVGGELKSYTDMMNQGIESAKERMIENAEALGADGVYAVSIATPQIAGGAAEIIMYGTAFKYLN
ncbi:MAG: heavy metal-binding domain-containing protein [Synergistaceae bacterium]|nr:heavy metal-binding domain-containing protein [Synergistaceae bacterium]